MALDPRIQKAIRDAVTKEGQGKALTDKISTWFEALANGSESFGDADSVHRRVELLFQSTEAEEPTSDDE